jgi:hypothetical protein
VDVGVEADERGRIVEPFEDRRPGVGGTHAGDRTPQAVKEGSTPGR